MPPSATERVISGRERLEFAGHHDREEEDRLASHQPIYRMRVHHIFGLKLCD